MKTNKNLPLGKLPPELLLRMFAQAPKHDPRLILGPGIGIDCAVVDMGDSLLVLKSDPITFATDEIGWYAVQVCTNDIATTGARPSWFLSTLLLPGENTSEELVMTIAGQVYRACDELGISVVGGHTEVTHGLDRPIIMGTLIGEVRRENLVTPRGAQDGDRVLLTKGIPIEATAILAREFSSELASLLDEDELERAAGFLYDPGISVWHDAQIALAAGTVTAMHDPTEGGLASALWEMAEASDKTLVIDHSAIPVPELSRKICRHFDIDPLAAIASGALLLTVKQEDSAAICTALEAGGIACSQIGSVEDGSPQVWSTAENKRISLYRPERDEIARLYEERS